MSFPTLMGQSQQPNKPVAPAYLIGATDQPLWNITLSQLIQHQAKVNADRQCLVFPQESRRWKYGNFYARTRMAAKALLAAGIKKGDHVGIFSGNSSAYPELFFASSHVGAALVVLNCTYTTAEFVSAVQNAECKLIVVTPALERSSARGILDMLSDPNRQGVLPLLTRVVLSKRPPKSEKFEDWDTFIHSSTQIKDAVLDARMATVTPNDVCNLQFTSGTTGKPKAAMLTHNNLINNGKFIGDRMRLSEKDIICCPPPLFHCFGLVLGMLAALTHGSSIVFPLEVFNPALTLQTVLREKCTALHGVPAMFSAQLELRKPHMDFSSLRTGIAAGAPVPRKMMEELRSVFNLKQITNTYGMTETSPASFMTFTDDPLEKRLSTVGKILPHLRAKVINARGDTVAVGERGEICIAGFALQKGYWKNPAETAKVMVKDDNGILWMHTGDEGCIDEDGYMKITGRIKDIIIRGGENIFPLEIEERLVQHPSILQASVVGVADARYGEVVAAFLQKRSGCAVVQTEELRSFVQETLGWHKAPVHIYWLGDGEDFPKTGSGKIQKHLLRAKMESTLAGKVSSKL